MASVIVVVVLVLTWVTFEIRRGFHGPILDHGITTAAEQYTYSAAWGILGVALLMLGITTTSRRREPTSPIADPASSSQGQLPGLPGVGGTLRWASLGVMLLTSGKVFLYDLAELEDLLRVLSFLGLGLTLMALGLLYMRFVFRPPTPPTPLTLPPDAAVHASADSDATNA